jgi:ribosomal protein S18 acetylase RimI-like enzyme
MSINLRRLGPADARAALPDLQPIYAAVFAEAPYHEGPQMALKFAGWVADESNLPGFTMVVAYNDGRAVGFAYGYTQAADDWFRGTDQPAPPDVLTAQRFVVMEWAVLNELRGQGVGRALMEELLTGRPERYAVLTVNPAAAARSIYERAGWRQVATTPASRQWPSMHVMVLDRHRPDRGGSDGSMVDRR